MPGKVRLGTRAGAHRSLLISLSDVERVLQYGVHDPAQAKGGLNYTRNDFFHCKKGDGLVILSRPTGCKSQSLRILGTKTTLNLDVISVQQEEHTQKNFVLIRNMIPLKGKLNQRIFNLAIHIKTKHVSHKWPSNR